MNTRFSSPGVGLVLVLLTGISFLVFCDFSVNSDEGVVLNSAWQIWNGKRMYLDFRDFTAPGASMLTLASWKIFAEPSYANTKFVFICIWLISAAAVIWCGQILSISLKSAFLSALLWLLASLQYPLINHNTLSSVVAACLLAALLSLLKCPSSAKSLLCGLLASVVLFCLQTKGLALIAVSLSSFLYYRMRPQCIFLFVVGVVVSSTILYCWWPLSVLLSSLFALPFENNYLKANQLQLMPLLSWSLIVIGMLLIAHVRKDAKLQFLALFQFGLMLSSLNLVDVPHIFINAFPAFIFSSVLLEQAPERLGSVAGFASSALIGVCVTGCLYLGFIRIQNPNIFHANAIRQLDPIFNIEELERARSVYAGPFIPGIYFHLRKTNPFVLAHDMALCDSECQRETVEILKTELPEFAILNYSIVEKFGYRANTPVDIFLRENYKLCDIDSAFILRALGDCPGSRTKENAYNPDT